MKLFKIADSRFKIGLLILVLAFAGGCASTQLATSIGIDVGKTFQKSAAKGEINAEQSIKAWPYISGLIRGILAHDYEYKVSMATQQIMEELDDLAMKETPLTGEEKGRIIGLYVRLEYNAVQELWNRYGISIWGAMKAYMAGG